MSTTLWYCCSCEGGPWNEDLYLACGNCQHKKCACCPTETVNAPSEFGYTASECSEITRDILRTSSLSRRVPPPEPLPTSPSPSMSFSVVTNEGIMLPSSLPSATPHYFTPLTQANLASFEHDFSGPCHSTNTSGLPRAHGEREFRWHCCYCGYSYNNYKLNPACTNVNCDHQRCGGCIVEEIIIKK